MILIKKTGTQWTADNTILNKNQQGLETDTNLIKNGDGVTAWNSLAYADPDNYTPTTGTNTYTADFKTNRLIALYNGLLLLVKFGNNNTGASTINVNSYGAKDIKKNGVAVIANELQGFKQIVYNGANFELL